MAQTSDSPLQMPAKRFTADQKPHRQNNTALEQFGNVAFLGLIPIGGVIGYAGIIGPPGFLICDGSAINRHQYAGLFSIIGTLYGVGDGSTTFNIPTRLKAGKIFTGNATAGTEGLMLIRTGVY